MTKSTLSRSAKATPKVEPEPDTNGTPLIDPISEPISVDSTEWTLVRNDGDVLAVKVTGGRGRVSISGNVRGATGGEVRIYRNESTKVYDAAFSGIETIYSDRVTVEKLFNKREAQKSINKYPEKEDAEPFGWGATAPAPSYTLSSSAFRGWHDLTPMEQSEYEARAEIGESGQDLYERETF